jgi:hypothetical protein
VQTPFATTCFECFHEPLTVLLDELQVKHIG